MIGPFWGSALLGGALAVSLHPLFVGLTRRGLGRKAAAGVCTASLTLGLLAPVALMATTCATTLRDEIGWLEELLGVGSLGEVDAARVPAALSEHAQSLLAHLPFSPDDAQRYLARALEALTPALGAVARACVNLPITAALMLLIFFALLAEGHRIPALLEDLSPMQRAQTRELLREFRDVAHAAIVGNLVTALVQTTAVTVGLCVAGVSHALLLGLAALPASFIPVAGSGLVYLPAAASLAATGRPLAAGVFAAGCAGVGALNTHVIKPFVVGGRISMHGALTFLSILGGIGVFGMMGLVAGPLAVAFAWTVVRIYRRDALREDTSLADAT